MRVSILPLINLDRLVAFIAEYELEVDNSYTFDEWHYPRLDMLASIFRACDVLA
jgi:hypothetical protein